MLQRSTSGLQEQYIVISVLSWTQLNLNIDSDFRAFCWVLCCALTECITCPARRGTLHLEGGHLGACVSLLAFQAWSQAHISFGIVAKPFTKCGFCKIYLNGLMFRVPKFTSIHCTQVWGGLWGSTEKEGGHRSWEHLVMGLSSRVPSPVQTLVGDTCPPCFPRHCAQGAVWGGLSDPIMSLFAYRSCHIKLHLELNIWITH